MPNSENLGFHISSNDRKILTPEMVNRNIRKKEEFKRNTYIKSCCFILDKRGVLFFTQFFITVVILFFSFFMVFIDNDACTYSGLITAILGLYIPSPIGILKIEKNDG